MKRLLVAAAFLSSLAISMSAVALGDDGGQDIASASELPIATHLVSGCVPARTFDDCHQFWRLSLQKSSKLVIDYGSTNTYDVSLAMYGPKVTDYTIHDVDPLWTDRTDTKHEVVFVAPITGRYPLLIHNCSGCGNPLAYELTAHVYQYTHVMLTGPRVARAQSAVTITGRVSGLVSGKVNVQSRSIRTPWKTLGLLSLRRNGSFVFKVHVGAPGTYRVRAVFYGDGGHLPSSAIYSFSVV